MLLLNVPFKEKDIAKNIVKDNGIYWNKEIQKWYVNDRKNYCRFAKWFPFKGKIIVFDYLYIVSGSYICNKCNRPTKVILLAASDFVDTDDVGDLLAEREDINDQNIETLFNKDSTRFIQKVRSIPFGLSSYLEEKFGYRKSYFKGGLEFFANHCEHCQSLLGDSYISGKNGSFRFNNVEDEKNLLVYKIALNHDLVVDGEVLDSSKKYLLKNSAKVQDMSLDNNSLQYDVNLDYNNVSCDIHVGINCGDIVLESIKNAKRQIKIISPYVHQDYLEELAEKSNNNIEVKLLASDDYILKKSKNNAIHKILAPIAFLDETNKKFNLRTLLKFLSPTKENFVPSEYKPVFPIKFYHNPYKVDFQPKFPYMHSKIYIIDDTVYLGSINFTRAGFNNQFETRITVKDESVVKEFNKLFDEIYKKGDYCSKKNIAEILIPKQSNPSIEERISKLLKPYFKKMVVIRKYIND